MTTETTRDALDTFLAGMCRESGGTDPTCWEASEPEGEFDEWSDEPWCETCCARRTLRAMYDAAVAAAYARGVEEAERRLAPTVPAFADGLVRIELITRTDRHEIRRATRFVPTALDVTSTADEMARALVAAQKGGT